MMPCTKVLLLLVCVLVGTFIILKIEDFLEKRRLKKFSDIIDRAKGEIKCD